MKPVPKYLYYTDLQNTPSRSFTLHTLLSQHSISILYSVATLHLPKQFLISIHIFPSFSYTFSLLWYIHFLTFLFSVRLDAFFFCLFIVSCQHFLSPNCNFYLILPPHTLWVLSPYSHWGTHFSCTFYQMLPVSPARHYHLHPILIYPNTTQTLPLENLILIQRILVLTHPESSYIYTLSRYRGVRRKEKRQERNNEEKTDQGKGQNHPPHPRQIILTQIPHYIKWVEWIRRRFEKIWNSSFYL